MMINYYQSLAIVTHRVGVLQKKKCAEKKKEFSDRNAQSWCAAKLLD